MALREPTSPQRFGVAGPSHARRSPETGKALTIPDVKLARACDLALRFQSWDGAASLPTIKALMTTCLERSSTPAPESAIEGYARYIAASTIVRARAGDREALDEYAGWIKKSSRGSLSQRGTTSWSRCGRTPSTRPMSGAARAMFLDPKSPWLPLIPVKEGRFDHQYMEQIASPLACVPAYREALLAALGDRTKVGTAVRKPEGVVQYALTAGWSNGFLDDRVPDPADRPGIEVPIRACDLVAWKLSAIDGAPECVLTWPEVQRDQAVDACAGYLRRYGPRLAVEYSPDEPYAANLIARLRFPALERPATPEDVPRGPRCLLGEGGRRGPRRDAAVGLSCAALAGSPSRHSRSTAVAARTQPASISSRTAGSGRRKTCSKVIAGSGFTASSATRRSRRVAASEIEFSPDRNRWLTLRDGLSARVETAELSTAVFRPGAAILVALRIYNVRGVERSAPTEFVRAGADGKPALRRGCRWSSRRSPRGATDSKCSVWIPHHPGNQRGRTGSTLAPLPGCWRRWNPSKHVGSISTTGTRDSRQAVTGSR